MAAPNFQPVALYYDSAQSLLTWTPGGQPFDLFNIAQVPLNPRPPTAGPLLMNNDDFAGNYLANSDLYPQGTNQPYTYNFSQWPYVDSVCYFSHHCVTIPTAMWTNMAHLNGIPVLGNLIPNGSAADVTLLFSSSDGQPDLCVAKLAAMAAYYGFDGWFLNVEIDLPSNVTAQDVADFLSKLRATGNQVVWYDAVTVDGYVSYQNCLDAQNNLFFQNSNGIFPNYWWDQAGTMVAGSVSVAKADSRSPLEVWTGVDVFGRGTFYPAGPQSCEGVEVAVNGGTSVGLYAPGWTFQNAGGSTPAQQYANFLALDQSFWATGTPSIGQSIPARPMPAALPFATNFDTGRGLSFAVRGTAVSSQPWTNFSLQGLLPTWRFKAVAGDASAFSPGLTDAVAYDGGASVQVMGAGAGATAADTVTYQLFDFSTPVSGTLNVHAVFQPAGTGGSPAVNLVLAFSDGSTMATSAAPTQSGDWSVLNQDLTVGAKTLTGLQLQVGPSVGGAAPGAGYGVTLGALSVATGAPAAPAGVGGLQGWVAGAAGPSGQQAYLSWTPPAGGARYCDVWQLGAGQPQWLMRVCANAAWLSNLTPGAGGTLSFGVQPVSNALVAQPIGQMAQVTVNFDAMVFDDGGMALMSGSPVTGLNLRSGNVLDSIQASNGAWDLPAHGGQGGSPAAVTLAAGDSIVSISGFTGDWYGWNVVQQITLTSAKGVTYGPYGSMAGAVTSTPFTLSGGGKPLRSLAGSLVNVPLSGGGNTNVVQTLSASFA